MIYTDTLSVFGTTNDAIVEWNGTGIEMPGGTFDYRITLSGIDHTDGAGSLTLDTVVAQVSPNVLSGEISFADVDVGDSHTASVTGVSVTGDAGLLGGADAFTFLNLDAVDQTADTLDWDWEMADATVANVMAGLGDGETLTIDYAVEITDATGETDTASLTFTFNNDALFV